MNKKYFLRIMVLILITAFQTACENTSLTDTQPEEEHFTYVLYNGLTESVTTDITANLQSNYERILNTLQVEDMPLVRIEIWGDYDNFLDAMEVKIGTRYIGATGYITSGVNICMYNTDNVPGIAVHEFAHLVSMQVNPTIPNNPRWLWEATAVYLAGEFVHPENFNFISDDHYPTISDLNAGFNMYLNTIYSVGYVLSEYIVDTWGNEGLIHLIENNGRIYDTFGITTEEFEAGWYLFIEREY